MAWSFFTLADDRRRVFLLLRYVFILVASYLLVLQDHGSAVWPPLLIAAALASNVALSFLSEERLSSPRVKGGVLVLDSVWAAGSLCAGGQLDESFLGLFTLVLLLALSSERLRLIVTGSIVAGAASVYLALQGSQSLGPALLQLTFFVTVALFFGHNILQVRRERDRAEKSVAWARDLEAKVAERTSGLVSLYQQSLQATEAKTRFVDQMSHELRTPLNIISGYAEMLGDADDEGERRFLCNEIHHSTVGLLALVENVLDLGKIESGQLEAALAPVDIEDLVRAAAARTGVRDGFEFTTDEDGLPGVQTDGGRLGAVLEALLKNAVEFAGPEAVRVEAALDAADGYVRILVIDRGPGIDPAHLDEIFEPFFHLREEQAGRLGAVGLGLSLSQRYIHLLGGELTVDSVLGEGSTFQVRLPYIAVPEAQDERRSVGRRSASASRGDTSLPAPAIDQSASA